MISAQSPVPGKLQTRTATVVQTGWRISLAIMSVGLVWSIIEQEALPGRLISLSDLFGEIADGNPGGLVALSILVILATPVVTAAVMAVTFLEERDKRFAAISAAVLAILLVTMFLAF